MSGDSAAKAPSTAATCQATFDGSHDNGKLADTIEAAHPNFACELFPVSVHSAGPVQDDEKVMRLIISPRDIDENGFVAEAPFFKVAKEGLSVLRSTASKKDLEGIVTDGMHSKKDDPKRAVLAVLQALVGGQDSIRASHDDQGERLFGVYDQTVPRRIASDSPVPTHAGIFLRWPPPGTAGRKILQKDYAGELKKLFLRERLVLETIYDGALVEINTLAQAGAFEITGEDNKQAGS